MLIYDVEIIKAISGKDEERLKDIEYCKGWDDHENMGISCLCAYDYSEYRYRVFTKSNKDIFSDLLKKHSIYIGFNNINFDNKVIHHAWGINIPDLKCYDILRKIWKGAGYDENIFNKETHSGYGLNACCKANFDLQKSGYGGYAPVEWQQGKIGNIIDYCLNDVRLTKLLFDKIMNFRSILDPKNPENKIQIEGP